MNRMLIVMGSLLAVVAAPVPAVRSASLGTAFTYQGFLEKPAGTALTDTCTFEFALCDDAAAACSPGTVSNHPGVGVNNGVFTVGDVDFGPDQIMGSARWMELSVQCTGDAMATVLSPRVELKPAPHALALPGLFTQENATSPNVVGGFSGNTVDPGVTGATIGGGGQSGFSNNVAANFGTVGGGFSNTASGLASAVGGGSNNSASGQTSTIAGGATNTAGGVESTVGGGNLNTADGDWSTVGGGIGNTADGIDSTVGGGAGNEANQFRATVSGGSGNTAGLSATVGGGLSNHAIGQFTTIGGGVAINALGSTSTAAGGDSHILNGGWSSIGGGYRNTTNGEFSTIAGGRENITGSDYSAVAGGRENEAQGFFSSVPGGNFNEAGGDFSLAAGRRAKVRDAAAAGDADGDEGTFIWADATDADFTSTGPNQFLIRASGGVGINTNTPAEALDVAGNIHASGTISSGSTVVVDGTARRVTSDANLDLHISTGRALRLEATATVPNVIAGHSGNNVLAPFPGATISGGGEAGLENQVTFSFGTIGGGVANLVSGHSSTVAGGRFNTAGADQSTVGGGQSNTARRNSTVAGGSGNTADNLVLGGATVGGGINNNALGGGSTVAGGETNAASDHYSMVPGGLSNAAGGQFSFAAGRRAKVRTAAQVGGGDLDGDQGTFVWADSTNADFTSTGPNQFLVRATGGMGLNLNSPAHPLHVGTNAGNGNGAHVTAGGTWTNGSSRQFKRDFREIDRQEVLSKLAELPVMQWQYHGEDENVRHVGPTAEDFAAAFGLGHDERYITTIDADGVALAAIQGLYVIVQEKDCQIEELRFEISELREMVKALVGQNGGGR